MLLGVFALGVLAPVPDGTNLAAVARLLTVRRAVLPMVGNSVLAHASPCDGDPRTLTDLTAQDAGLQKLDLGHAGENLEEGVNLATLALRQPRAKSVVMFLSSFQMSQDAWPTLQTQMFRLATSPPRYAMNDLGGRFREGLFLSGRDIDTPAFTYKGIRYPDYDHLKLQYLQYEKAKQGCPETLGSNLAFVEAYYWFNYISYRPFDPNFDDIRRLAGYARMHGHRLLVVLLPVDLDDVRRLNPLLSDQIARRTRQIADRLRANGVRLLDLSDAVAGDGFADRWCACGHLDDAGRGLVAARTAAALTQTPDLLGGV